jgi:hypothetical protein
MNEADEQKLERLEARVRALEAILLNLPEVTHSLILKARVAHEEAAKGRPGSLTRSLSKMKEQLSGAIDKDAADVFDEYQRRISTT